MWWGKRKPHKHRYVIVAMPLLGNVIWYRCTGCGDRCEIEKDIFYDMLKGEN